MLSGSLPAAERGGAALMPQGTFAEVLAWLRKPMTLLDLAVGAILTFLFLWVTGILAGTVVVNLPWLQRSWLLWLTILLSTGLALTLLMLPIHIFRKYAQHQRLEQIESFYSADIITEYFTRFWAGSNGIGAAVKAYRDAPEGSPAEEFAADVLTAKFKAVLNDMFCVDRFRGATRLLFAVAACVLFAAFETGIMWGVDFGTSKELAHYLFGIKLSPAAIAAIFGTYTWVASDVINRLRLADLSSSDIHWYTLRFVVAIPLGMVIDQFAGFKVADTISPVTSIGPVLAFVISMFSLSRIQAVLGALVNRGTGVAVTTVETADANDLAVRLPGIDQRLADRLAEEGVTTIAQIATCDPVRLSSRSNIPFNLMLEYIDAAILWQFVGPKLLQLREYGWAGASHVLAFAKRGEKGLEDVLNEYRVRGSKARRGCLGGGGGEAEARGCRGRSRSRETGCGADPGVSAGSRRPTGSYPP